MGDNGEEANQREEPNVLDDLAAGGAVGGGDGRQVPNNRPNHVDGPNDEGNSDATNKRPNHVSTSNGDGNGVHV